MVKSDSGMPRTAQTAMTYTTLNLDLIRSGAAMAVTDELGLHECHRRSELALERLEWADQLTLVHGTLHADWGITDDGTPGSCDHSWLLWTDPEKELPEAIVDPAIARAMLEGCAPSGLCWEP